MMQCIQLLPTHLIPFKFKDSKSFPKTLYDASICNLWSPFSAQDIPCNETF